MNPKRILVTGASGCIGHYLTEALIQETEHELYLLVRNPNKLQVNTQSRPGITVLQSDLREIGQFAKLLKTMDTAVLAATAWGGAEVYDTNVLKTIELLKLLDSDVCQQVIYFSTASVLDSNNQPLKAAGELGTDYIRSKYDCLSQITKLALADGGNFSPSSPEGTSNSPITPRMTILFPTLVLGGDAQKPYSHLSSGLSEVVKWIDLIRFFKADGSFHFIHGRDIATVVRYLIDHPSEGNQLRSFVVGQERLTANQAVKEVCAYLNKKIYLRIPLSLSLANLLIVLFRIQMADWDRFCLDYRHFTYQNPMNPAILGLPNYCASMADVLKISGIKRGARG